MFGRLAYALAVGLALGVILAGAIAFGIARRGAPPTPSNGDLAAPYDLGVTLTEQFLAQQFNNPPTDIPEVQELQSLNLRDVSIRLLPNGRMQIAGKSPLLGLSTSVRVVLLPRVVRGQLVFSVVEGRAGALGLPAAIADNVETVVNRQIRSTLDRTAFQVVAIEPGAGTLQIRLR